MMPAISESTRRVSSPTRFPAWRMLPGVADMRGTGAAMVTDPSASSGAAGTGGWDAEMISPSGHLVRNELREKNP